MTAVGVVALATPFVLSYLIQLLSSHMKNLAAGVLRLRLGPEEELSGFAKECAIDLAVSFYRYISFIVSVLLSTVSAMAYILQTSVQLLAFVAAALFIAEIIVFFFRWHPMSIQPNAGEVVKRGREMFAASVATTTIMLVLTIAAKLS